MNYTENYQLPQWEETDRVLMEDFNDNNSKIDTAMAEMPKIAFGSYVGTGERGSQHPNTLTFPFEPKAVLITGEELTGLSLGTMVIRGQLYSAGLGVTSSSNHGLQLILTWNGNSLSWYTGSNYEYNQLNALNMTYWYLAIG